MRRVWTTIWAAQTRKSDYVREFKPKILFRRVCPASERALLKQSQFAMAIAAMTALARRAGLRRRTWMRRVGKLGRARMDRIAAIRPAILERARGRCECCRTPPGPNGPLDIEHAIPRSQGGEDSLRNCWLACRYGCHAAKHKHRLSVTPGGDGTFTFLWMSP